MPSAAETGRGVLKLLVLGDSLTAGYGLAAEHAFTNRLQAALDKEGLSVRVINSGVSGDTTTGGLARLNWALADKPDAAIVELGANDGLRGLSPEISRRNLDQIITRLKAAGVPVMLAGMLAPPNLGREYGGEFAAIYSGLAKKHQVLFYRFFLDGVAAKPELNQADGIHPNAIGVEIIVRRMLPMVRELLRQVKNKEGRS